MTNTFNLLSSIDVKNLKFLETVKEKNKPDLHVLLVDDDFDELYLFNEALEHAGLNIKLSRANNGNHLLSFLLSEPTPDLVFMDINMPYKDGLEALTEIRNNPRFHNLPLVIYSTTNNINSINTCYKKGADLFVIKPNNFDGMVKVVKKVCAVDWRNYKKPTIDEFVVSEGGEDEQGKKQLEYLA